jgi:hypothetical protein
VKQQRPKCKRASPWLTYPMAAILAGTAGGCRNDADSAEFVHEGPSIIQNASAASPLVEEDKPNRGAKQAFLKAKPSPAPVMIGSMVAPVRMIRKASPIKSEPPLLPVKHTKTRLIAFENAPFPYRGVVPGSGRAFLDVNDGSRRGHRTASGEIHWEDKTFSDARTLLHVPRGFDLRRPSLMVVFLHGHGATLQRDVIERQRVPEQVSEAGVNAVLVAPQLASNAADSSAGKLWERDGFQRFLDEASQELTKMHGDPRSQAVFDRMPIVIVAYSGGYATAASCIRNGGAGARVRGIVLLDALYGEMDTFANWISARDKAFFLSAYANSTRARNAELAEMLKSGREVTVGTKLKGPLRGGTVTFISTAPETEHRDFVTKAWAFHPIKDILQRLKAEAK